ncbi:MAG: GxxExxY protein [Patescibacteria group bacterium]|nr:GxxExxY protein [Patescibacteria group bacterium]
MLYEDLTRKIIGALYKVYNALGYGYKEKEYQKALAMELEKLGLKYQRELCSNLKYEDRVITKFFVDFLIESLVVLELKVANEIYPKHLQQVIQYLKNHSLKVGLIGAITPNGIIIKRVAN